MDDRLNLRHSSGKGSSVFLRVHRVSCGYIENLHNDILEHGASKKLAWQCYKGQPTTPSDQIFKAKQIEPWLNQSIAQNEEDRAWLCNKPFFETRFG